MLKKFAEDLRHVGLSSSVLATPPQVLREQMEMTRDFETGTPTLDNALSLWWDLRGGSDTAPLWSLFVPFKHPQLLPHVMIYELIEGRFRCALIGETAAENLPFRLARKFVDDVMPPANLADVTKRLNAALECGKPNFVEKTMAWEIGCDLKSYRALQLPFFGGDGKSPRVMSVMNFREDRI